MKYIIFNKIVKNKQIQFVFHLLNSPYESRCYWQCEAADEAD